MEENDYLVAEVNDLIQCRKAEGLGFAVRMEGNLLTVLTLNCWGIPWISKDLRVRMESIAEHIASGAYDFVFLQEVWSKSDYQMIARRVQLTLPYSHFFDSGILGTGLCLFSKVAIQRFLFQPFTVNGYIHHVHQGDWFGGKGVGLVSVVHSGLTVHLYIVHLLAKYDNEYDELLAHRLAQATQTARFIEFTRRGADVCFLAGDLNASPDELSYETIVLETGMRDSFLLSSRFNTDLNAGKTNGTPNNSYTRLQDLKEFPYGQRIDYVFCWTKNDLTAELVDCINPLPDRVPHRDFSHSDHEAVCCTFKIKSNSTRQLQDSIDQSRVSTHRMKLMDIVDKALINLQSDRRLYWLNFSAASTLLIASLFLHFYFLDWAFGDRVWLWNCFWFMLISFLVTVIGFSFAMASVWVRTERESLLSWKLAIN